MVLVCADYGNSPSALETAERAPDPIASSPMRTGSAELRFNPSSLFQANFSACANSRSLRSKAFF